MKHTSRQSYANCINSLFFDTLNIENEPGAGFEEIRNENENNNNHQ